MIGSDIDTLVLGPKHVVIEDFFSDFPPVLERLAPDGAIEKMTPVPDAYVPIIKLELSGISIDLLFARLMVPSIPLNLDLKNNDYLRGLDEREVRSLNGTRVTDEILELVPQQKTFRLALRAIKLWAQSKQTTHPLYGWIVGLMLLSFRSCYLLQRGGISRWCGVGHAGSPSLPVVPSGDRFSDCWQILSNHEQMGVASTCLIEAD